MTNIDATAAQLKFATQLRHAYGPLTSGLIVFQHYGRFTESVGLEVKDSTGRTIEPPLDVPFDHLVAHAQAALALYGIGAFDLPEVEVDATCWMPPQEAPNPHLPW